MTIVTEDQPEGLLLRETVGQMTDSEKIEKNVIVKCNLKKAK